MSPSPSSSGAARGGPGSERSAGGLAADQGELSKLAFDAAGLVTVVAQDRLSGELRMLAHANAEAIAQTLATGVAHFYSRSRAALWRKGETSGHELWVVEVWADCDGDAVVYLVDPVGPSCHTGRTSCFFRLLAKRGAVPALGSPAAHARPELAGLFAELELRASGSAETSYTKRLLAGGPGVVGGKIVEEAGELAAAIATETDERVVSEAADVVYHLLVGLLARGLHLRDVEAELARRAGVSGLLEKASRKA